MKKTMLVGLGLAGGLVAGAAIPNVPEAGHVVVQTVATVIGKPGSYCKKADHGRTVTYTTPAGHKERTKCVSYTAWHWKKV